MHSGIIEKNKPNATFVTNSLERPITLGELHNILTEERAKITNEINMVKINCK